MDEHDKRDSLRAIFEPEVTKIPISSLSLNEIQEMAMRTLTLLSPHFDMFQGFRALSIILDELSGTLRDRIREPLERVNLEEIGYHMPILRIGKLARDASCRPMCAHMHDLSVDTRLYLARQSGEEAFRILKCEFLAKRTATNAGPQERIKQLQLSWVEMKPFAELIAAHPGVWNSALSVFEDEITRYLELQEGTMRLLTNVRGQIIGIRSRIEYVTFK